MRRSPHHSALRRISKIRLTSHYKGALPLNVFEQPPNLSFVLKIELAALSPSRETADECRRRMFGIVFPFNILDTIIISYYIVKKSQAVSD